MILNPVDTMIRLLFLSLLLYVLVCFSWRQSVLCPDGADDEGNDDTMITSALQPVSLMMVSSLAMRMTVPYASYRLMSSSNDGDDRREEDD